MILLRHGQSEFNVIYGKTRQNTGIRDPALTDEGRRQVVAAAETLSCQPIRRVISSPYRRTLETASIIADALGVVPEVDVIVGERVVFTSDLGTPRSQLARHWPRLVLDHLDEEWWPRPEETEQALDDRSFRFRQRMVEDDGWQGTLVITHWGFIRSLTGLTVGNANIVAFDPEADHPGGGELVPVIDPC